VVWIRWKTALFLSVVALASIWCPATRSSGDSVSVTEAFRGIQNVTADFLQRRHLGILTDPLISEGRLFFDVSGNVRWEYITPLRSVMLQRGDRVSLYHFSEGDWKPGVTQSVEARRMVFAEMSQWFRGRFDESRAFSQVYLPGPPGRFVLIPKEGVNRFIRQIEIVLSEKPGIIERVEILEPGESRTSIEFRNVEINSNLPSNIFDKP
jgi:outer membrane lipoprotein-sorting protein